MGFLPEKKLFSPFRWKKLEISGKKMEEMEFPEKKLHHGPLYLRRRVIISPKFENFGDIMFLVAPPPPSPPPSPPPLHANACTGHNFVTKTPFKFIFANAIKVPDYKNPMNFGINRKNKMASGGHFV